MIGVEFLSSPPAPPHVGNLSALPSAATVATTEKKTRIKTKTKTKAETTGRRLLRGWRQR